MTRIILVTFFLCAFCVQSVLAQKEFIYARELQALSQGDIDAFDTLVGQLSSQDSIAWEKLQAFIKDPFAYVKATPANPIIDPTVLEKLRSAQKEVRMKLLEKKGGAGAMGPNDYPNDVLGTAELTSKIIYATGQLLLERAKEELYASHFQQVKAAFDKERSFIIKDASSRNDTIRFKIKQLLPNSYLVISNFDELVKPQLGETLQKAFELDLKELYKNATKHLLPDSVKESWAYLFVDASLQSIEDLNDGQHPASVIESLAVQYSDIPTSSNNHSPEQSLSIGINLLSAISESLVAKAETSGALGTPKPYWIGKKAFSDLGPAGLKYYVCLLYLNHQQLFASLGLDATKIAGGDKHQDFLNLIRGAIAQISWIESKIQELRVTKVEDKTEMIKEYTKAIISFFELIKPSLCDLGPETGKICTDFDALKPQIHLVLSIPTDIKSGEYAQAFLKTSQTIDVFLALYNTSNTDPSLKDTELIRYLTLASDIVQADSVKQIKNILDAAILPVGSYSLKRKLKYTTSINAYVGLAGGGETILSKDLDYNSGGQIGPFAPIGIDFSWGTKGGRSNGIFLAIVDLGAVVNMYFQGSDKVMTTDANGMPVEEDLEVETLPELKFSHIFAPGLMYTRGWKESPVTTGLGVQLAPDLRSVSVGNADITTESVIRYSFFIGLDIPLFNISKGGKVEKTDPED